MKFQTPIFIGSVMIIRCNLLETFFFFFQTKWYYFNLFSQDNVYKLETGPLKSCKTDVIADELSLSLYPIFFKSKFWVSFENLEIHAVY